MDGRSGELFVLEVNANPGLSGDPAVVSVGRMLQLAGMSFADLLARIIGHALRRTAAETAIGVMAGVR